MFSNRLNTLDVSDITLHVLNNPTFIKDLNNVEYIMKIKTRRIMKLQVLILRIKLHLDREKRIVYPTHASQVLSTLKSANSAEHNTYEENLKEKNCI